MRGEAEGGVDTALAAGDVDNTGEEEVLVLVVVAALGILRGIWIEGAGKGEFKWENGPDEAADDMGMGCSLSILIRAAFPEELLGLWDVFGGGICGEE